MTTEGNVTEAEIASHWKEEELIHPSPSFIGQANVADQSVFDRFAPHKFPECLTE